MSADEQSELEDPEELTIDHDEQTVEVEDAELKNDSGVHEARSLKDSKKKDSSKSSSSKTKDSSSSKKKKDSKKKKSKKNGAQEMTAFGAVAMSILALSSF